MVDTSVLVDFFRGKNTPATAALEGCERDGLPYSIPAICCQEVLQGALDWREWRMLAEYLESQDLLLAHDPVATHVAAARLYYDARRKGVTIPSSVDCWIAQLVLENGGVLLHDDEDFERIKQVRPLRTSRGRELAP